MGERDDELLVDPPAQRPIGGLLAYRAGRRARILVFSTVFIAVVVAVLVGRWWALKQEERMRASPWQISPEHAETATRELVWTGGRARLGLSRRSPGIEVIRLPDRVIRLAPGTDHAQVEVDVRDGETVEVRTLVGEIEQYSLLP